MVRVNDRKAFWSGFRSTLVAALVGAAFGALIIFLATSRSDAVTVSICDPGQPCFFYCDASIATPPPSLTDYEVRCVDPFANGFADGFED